ncbi:MAG TPA: hypothetical protein VJ806_11600 [Luteimonas sp.]|nr:hypothetical protein [Luteimonas sp.]
MRKIVFVDIDDTLVRSAGSKRIPIPSVVSRVRALKAEGAEVFLWSTGGADYCKATAGELGLADCIAGCLPKPTVYIDDQPVGDWRDCRHVYPMNADSA